MKLVRQLVVILLITAVGLFLARNVLAKTAMLAGVKSILGLEAQMDSMDIDLGKTAVGIKALRVFNPRGFDQRVMLDVPQLYIDCDLPAIIKGKIHLESLRLEMKEFHVVKSADNKLNIQQIKALQAPPASSGEQKTPEQAQKAAGMPPLVIDTLELKVGKVVYSDYTKTPPAVQEFNVNINERYQNITNAYSFAGLVVSRALMKTTVAQLADFDVKALESNAKALLKSSATEMLDTMTDSKSVVEKIGKETAGSTSDALDGAAGKLRKLFDKK